MAKIWDEPHEQRRGWLRNGNPPGDLDDGTTLRCHDEASHGLPVPGDAEPTTLPITRREEYRSQDSCRAGAESAGTMEARGVLARDARHSCELAPPVAGIVDTAGDHAGRCRTSTVSFESELWHGPGRRGIPDGP